MTVPSISMKSSGAAEASFVVVSTMTCAKLVNSSKTSFVEKSPPLLPTIRPMRSLSGLLTIWM